MAYNQFPGRQNYGQQGSGPQGSNPNYGPQGSNPNYGSNFGPSGPQQGPQNFHQNASQSETNVKLSEVNMKLTMQLASKDTVIDEKTKEIESLNNHSRQLVEQIAQTKASSIDRVAALEREIQLLKAEIEESKASKLRELESQRAYLQKDVDQATKIAEDRDSRVNFLSGQLAKIKFDLEDEGTRLSSFLSKTMGAVQLANATCQQNGVNGAVLVEAESNLGFSKLTVRSIIHPDGKVVSVK